VALLGLGLAPTTQEIWKMGAEVSEGWLFSGSSVWTGISSWTALLGDLGLLGLGFYLWMACTLWHCLKGREWQTAVAKSALLMSCLLGVIYSWLEEPAFTLLVALVVGLALTAVPHGQERARQASEIHA
jgi:hypothetical protein